MEDFEPWYQSERPLVLAACVALAGDLDAAREATDEAFTRALERWPKVSKMASPGGWTQTVALNQLRRDFRRRRGERSRSSDQALASRDPEGLPDPELWSSVRSLPPRQQTALVLRYVHDLSNADISDLMGISRGTVASTLDEFRHRGARSWLIFTKPVPA
jgi:RNA polymerase sigma-70 factor (ECF subfamily)